MQSSKIMGKNGEETKTSLFYILVKSYDYMFSNKHIKTVSKFIEVLKENQKHTMYILLQWQVKNSMHVHFKNNTLLLDTFTFESNMLCEKMLDKGISKLLNGKD